MTSPNAVGLYSRIMAEAIDEAQLLSNSTAFQSFFGNPSFGGSQTIYAPFADVIDIDIERANGEPVAALIQRGFNGGENIGKNDNQIGKFSTISRLFPLAEEQTNFDKNQLMKRLPGEPVYGSNKSDLMRLRTLAAKAHVAHMRKFIRTFEVLAAESILTGKMSAIWNTTNTDLIYDFRRNADNFVTVAAPWDTGTPDIDGDIDDACDKLREIGKVTPDVMVLGSKVAQPFFNDATMQKKADVRTYNFVSVGQNNGVPAKYQALVDGGMTYRGYIITSRGRTIQLFTYNDIYTDVSGVTQKYMPENKVLLAYYGARADRYFGPSTIITPDSAQKAWFMERFGFDMNSAPMPPNVKGTGIISPAMFYYDAYESNNHSNITIRTQTAPIFATNQTDAFAVLSGVITESE